MYHTRNIAIFIFKIEIKFIIHNLYIIYEHLIMFNFRHYETEHKKVNINVLIYKPKMAFDLD